MKHILQIYGVYSFPFGYGQRWVNHGPMAWIVGGFQLNGQLSHQSGQPFSVVAGSNSLGSLAPGIGSTYAQLVKPYHQLGGHNRGAAGGSDLSGGKGWFDPTSFANPDVASYTTANATPPFSNTGRNQFRGPGVTNVNASLFRSFHIWHEHEFQVRFEAFNVFNHALLYSNPNATVNGTLGTITSFGPGYSPSAGARSLQFSGRYNF